MGACAAGAPGHAGAVRGPESASVHRFAAPALSSAASMSTTPACPQCQSDVTYDDGAQFVCAECAHEWSKTAAAAVPDEGAKVFRDSNGNPLADGDTVVVIKDLKVKGATSALKAGTKVKNIRLVDGDHDIDCRIEGFGAMKLKSEFVRKA
jgi:protein PhnA